MSQLEKRGTPAMAWTAAGFAEDAHWSAQLFGCPDLPIIVVAEPFTNNLPDVIRTMVDGAMPQVVAGLTQAPEAVRIEYEHITTLPDAVLHYHGADLLECFDRMNTAFIAAGWSDGMPLVPPTPAKVTAMIAAAGLPADHVVGVFEPGFGIGTIEKIAANAVMAGCKPEAMPIVVAMAECLLDPKLGLRTFAMSTSPQAPVVLVSGPYAQQIGMNSGCCALGPGSPSAVNVAIGRASRLIMMNVGLCYPGISDMDTIGTSFKFSACVAENEARNPFEPYRVMKGYGRETTTVSVCNPFGMCEINDFVNNDPARLAECIGSASRNPAQVITARWLIASVEKMAHGSFSGDGQNLIMLCPDHAQLFHRSGWSLQDIKEALYLQARLPFREALLNKREEGFRLSHPHLQWLWDKPETLISIFNSPEVFDIFVVGADAGKSNYFYGGQVTVTREVRINA